MEDTYGVIPGDIAAQLPRLFEDGFAETTKPSLAVVTGFISDADAVATLTIQRATGKMPTASDDAARLARRYIVDSVVGRVIRLVYTGNDPADVNSAASPYEASAKLLLGELAALIPAMTPRAIGWTGAPSSTTQNTVVW